MKFVKGIIVGSIVSAGIALACAENMERNKKKMMKKGRQAIKRMGII